jgi:RNA polymerase sigma-H factor
VIKGSIQRRDNFGPLVKYKKLSKEELEEFIEKAKNGDELAFKEILSHMHGFLVKLKDRYFIQGSDSEDVYQEGAIKLLNVIEKFDPNKGSFSSFAQQAIEKHIITCINRERAQKRIYLNNAYSLDASFSDQNDSEDGKMSFIDSIEDESRKEGFSPVDVVQKDYEMFIVEEINKVLSSMESKVFYLRFIEHMSYRDIAVELNFFKTNKKGTKTPDQKSVDNAIMRSRPKIKRVLEKMGLAPKDFSEFLKSSVFSEDKKSGKKSDKNQKLKKRGRPPKKRGPGRPPKPRPRGRPPKKRGRGRPPLCVSGKTSKKIKLRRKK